MAAVIVLLGGHGAVRADSKPPPRPPVKKLLEPDPVLRDLIGFRVHYRDLLRRHDELVRTVRIRYRAWNGESRRALVVLPRWYGRRVHPRIPLVISPHGRGLQPETNDRFWGGLPAFGPFAVVSPEGQGRRLVLYSWGWRGQIDDLARMPKILQATLPWLHVDPRRVYALGGSMGGQETLLLTARYPQILAGASALDSATDMAARYDAFPQLRNGASVQRLARIEIGGTPRSVPAAYAARSPMHYVAELARAGVPLHIWWSVRDRIVVNQQQESGRLYRAIVAANPEAPVTRYVGTWAHTAEMQATARLPLALVKLKLIKLDEPLPAGAKP
ncbi:MAG TPA: prolyl oligopeptidase family serine peptidase [Gaiellaceae bacterium]